MNGQAFWSHTMHITGRLFQSCRITLFTRKHCGLCVSAKSVLSDVWDSRPFEFKEVDIVDPAARSWKDLYDFDVPVVWQTSFYSVVCHLAPGSSRFAGSCQQGWRPRRGSSACHQSSEAYASLHSGPSQGPDGRGREELVSSYLQLDTQGLSGAPLIMRCEMVHV